MTARSLTRKIFLPDEAATRRLAERIAPRLGAGDSLLLEGPIGAGKSFLARALIQSRLAAAGRMEDVPSPTFTLVQIYDVDGIELWHCDLYRIAHPEELWELGLDQAMEEAACVIEWPDRLGGMTPVDALRISLGAGVNEGERHAVLSGTDRWRELLEEIDG